MDGLIRFGSPNCLSLNDGDFNLKQKMNTNICLIAKGLIVSVKVCLNFSAFRLDLKIAVSVGPLLEIATHTFIFIL